MSEHGTSSARDLTMHVRSAGVGHQSAGSCATPKCEVRGQKRYIRGRLQLRYCPGCAAAIDARRAAKGAV